MLVGVRLWVLRVKKHAVCNLSECFYLHIVQEDHHLQPSDTCCQPKLNCTHCICIQFPLSFWNSSFQLITQTLNNVPLKNYLKNVFKPKASKADTDAFNIFPCFLTRDVLFTRTLAKHYVITTLMYIFRTPSDNKRANSFGRILKQLLSIIFITIQNYLLVVGYISTNERNNMNILKNNYKVQI